MRSALLFALLLGCGSDLRYPAWDLARPRPDGGATSEIPECRDSVLVDFWGATCEPRCLPPTQVGILCTEMLGIAGWSAQPLKIDYAAAHAPPSASCPRPNWRVWRLTELSQADVNNTDFGAAARTMDGTDCSSSNLQETPSRLFIDAHRDLTYYLLDEVFPTE